MVQKNERPTIEDEIEKQKRIEQYLEGKIKLTDLHPCDLTSLTPHQLNISRKLYDKLRLRLFGGAYSVDEVLDYTLPQLYKLIKSRPFQTPKGRSKRKWVYIFTYLFVQTYAHIVISVN